MYLSKLTIENFRCFGSGENRFEMALESGLTALVGENDSGKTAVIDALRFEGEERGHPLKRAAHH